MATDYQSYLITAIADCHNFKKHLHLETLGLRRGYCTVTALNLVIHSFL